MRKTGADNRKPVSIVGGSTFGRYAKISSAKTTNMFVSDGWLVNTAGYKRIYEFLPEGQGRGTLVSTRGNIAIAVVNSSVYALNNNLAVTFIGNLATQSGEVFLAENLSSQICIVDGLNAYIYNYSLPPNLTTQTLSDSLIPSYVDYHNSFFLFGSANTSNWYAYAGNAATTITKQTQLALQTKSDFALAVVRLPGQANNVLAMGSTVSEIWTQTGGLQNYRRNSTVNIDYGCASVSTIARSDQFVIWLAINESNAPVIMVLSRESITPISSDGIDYVLSQIKYPSQSTASLNRQDGHLFYQLTFFNPADNITFLYDFTTQMFFNLTDGDGNYHPARNYMYFQGKTYFTSLNNGSLYQASTNFTTYDDNLPSTSDPAMVHEIPRIRITDTIAEDDSSQFRANTFCFTIEQGNDTRVTGISLMGNENLLITEDTFVQPDDIIYTEYGTPIADESSGAGIGLGDLPIPYQPRVDCAVSRDGGITWSNNVGRFLNPVGIRENILNWENMGACNYLTIRLRFNGLDRFVASQGFVEVY